MNLEISADMIVLLHVFQPPPQQFFLHGSIPPSHVITSTHHLEIPEYFFPAFYNMLISSEFHLGTMYAFSIQNAIAKTI